MASEEASHFDLFDRAFRSAYPDPAESLRDRADKILTRSRRELQQACKETKHLHHLPCNASNRVLARVAGIMLELERLKTSGHEADYVPPLEEISRTIGPDLMAVLDKLFPVSLGRVLQIAYVDHGADVEKISEALFADAAAYVPYEPETS